MGNNKAVPYYIGGLVLIVLAGAAIAVSLKPDDSSTSDTATPTNTSTSESTASPAAGTSGSTSSTGEYKDGSYTATGNYRSPGGQETLGVQLTVTDGVVAAVKVTPQATGGQSLTYQTRFASGISSVVTGKSLDSTFDTSVVNGSSLTGTGFQEALESIKSQAGA